MQRPAIDMNERAPVLPDPKRLPEENSSKIIIAVDDDPETTALITSIGRKAGYLVLGAASGEECLSMLFRVTPQLILLDVRMAGLDGFETCRRVRNDPRATHVPIAFLTSLKTVRDVKRGIAAGGDDFIVKPFYGTQLRERIEFLVSHGPLLRARRRRRPVTSAIFADAVEATPIPVERVVRRMPAPSGGGAHAADIAPGPKAEAFMINSLAPREERRSLRQIAALPLAPFLVWDDRQKAPGVFAASLLPLWWTAVTAMSGDQLAVIKGDLDRLLDLDDDIGLEALSQTLLGAVATLTGRLAAMLQDPKSFHPASVKALARRGAAADMMLISEILLVARPLHEAIRTFHRARPDDGDRTLPIAELSPPLVSEARQCYARIGDGGVAGRLFVTAILNCLEKPWQIFRLTHALSRNRDASIISGTELCVVGDRLIFAMDAILTAVDAATAAFHKPAAPIDFDALQALVARYTDMYEGFLAEIDIRRGSAWGEALLRGRANMRHALDESRLRRIVAAIPLPFQPSDDAAMAGDALPALRFLTYVAQRGERHGFGVPALRLLAAMRETAAGQIEAAIGALRACPSDGDAPAALQQASALIEILFKDSRDQPLGEHLIAALAAVKEGIYH